MKTLKAIVNTAIIVMVCVGCSQQAKEKIPKLNDVDTSTVVSIDAEIELAGRWIMDLDADVMLDPQTSGLKYANGYLYSVSDGSANVSQTRRLHQISMRDSSVTAKYGPTTFSKGVAESCFYNYLANKPDYEALVPVNGDDDVWIFVTEDASRTRQLSDACQEQYKASGSTLFPTLVVRLKLTKNQLEVTHVRPVQFDPKARVGNFPNDGIEGLTITRDGRLLLGLEKDDFGHARVFELSLTDDFWQTQTFAKAKDSKLLLPKFTSGNHPINGMDVYYPSADSQGYLFAAARNDSELWIVDLAKRKPTKRVKLTFRAPSVQSVATYRADESAEESALTNGCEETHIMNNASIEGLAVVENEVWLVNDPWKVNYIKNAVCEADEPRYKRMAPLLIKLEIGESWFE
jgi:hypothetical protein